MILLGFSTLVPAVPAAAASRLGSQVLDVATLRSQQEAVVRLNHRLPLGEASFAVDQLDGAVGGDQRAMTAAEAAEQEATARMQQATARLGADRAQRAAVDAAVVADQSRLAADRAALRAIAVGLYTGEITNPQPTSLHSLEASQQKIIDAAEVETVTGVVDGNLNRDLAATAADQHRQVRLVEQVDSDRSLADSSHQHQAAAAARTASAQTALASDQSRLARARARLGAAQASLASDLAAVTGPPATGGVSLVGGAALDANELVTWYRDQGYVDLTSAPIVQLASWYLQAGAQEGIRGDVAFAQAVLETGGFSSPDSVTLNNYAGIGHCDSCAAGWAFPSPQGGVLGHTQLLRIFAAGAPPPGAPPPVLASLTPGRQGRRGCCPTWESLTGVWASDPAYGAHILALYEQMLGLALTRPS